MQRRGEVFQRERCAADRGLARVNVKPVRRDADKVAHPAWFRIDADRQAVAMPGCEGRPDERGALGWPAAVRMAENGAAGVAQLEEPAGVTSGIEPKARR